MRLGRPQAIAPKPESEGGWLVYISARLRATRFGAAGPRSSTAWS